LAGVLRRAPSAKSEGTPPPRVFTAITPVKSVKGGATVIATFTDPLAKMPDGKEAPFLVSMQFGKGRVLFLGSSELWRLARLPARCTTSDSGPSSAGTPARAAGRDKPARGVLGHGQSSFTTGAPSPDRSANCFGPTLEALARSRPGRGCRSYRSTAAIAARSILTPKPSQSEWAGWFQAPLRGHQAGRLQAGIADPE